MKGRRSRPDRVRETGTPYGARIEGAHRAFPSDAQLAEALGVDRAQVMRWRSGRTVPSAEVADRLVGLDAVVELLASHLEPRSIAKWLHGVNAHLDNRRPLDVLKQGNLSAVIGAVEAMKSGSHA